MSIEPQHGVTSDLLLRTEVQFMMIVNASLVHQQNTI